MHLVEGLRPSEWPFHFDVNLIKKDEETFFFFF